MGDVSVKRFTKDFTQQEPISEEAIERAVEIMRSGKLHRYNVGPGEKGEAALLEEEFAAYMGAKYCLSCASCGMAMFLALKSVGVEPGDKILCNAYTLAPVPGAIHNAGAEIVLVEITDDYTIDLVDLEKKAADPDVKWFLISHMRGHLTDMDRLMEICENHGLTLVEDCAHTMGATWDGKKSGSFGKVGCYSTQTYKHMNSGEGGLLTTDDPDVIARAIIHSGSYMLYERHTSRPGMEVFEKVKKLTPNYSSRMDNLRASMLRFQLRSLDNQCERWNERYRVLEEGFNMIPGITCPKRPEKETYVGSSIQFSLLGQDEASIRKFLAVALERGVELKWFGDSEPVGFTSAYASWQYFGNLPELKVRGTRISHITARPRSVTLRSGSCRKNGELARDVAEATRS